MIALIEPFVLKSVVKESVAVAVTSLFKTVIVGAEVHQAPGFVITNPVITPLVRIASALASV